jgi:adenylate cyclase
MTPRLDELRHCFQGVIPSLIATCGRDGEPNVTYLSQVYFVDANHVALSCQFFNKTKRNVQENPFASVHFYDPITFDAWRLKLRFLRSETSGPLFDTMALRIQVIASHTGMAGVFKLISADIYEVLALEPVEGFLLPPDPILDSTPSAQVSTGGPMTEIRGLQAVSERIARAKDLDSLLNGTLLALDEMLGFAHSMVLLSDECTQRLVTIASRGYGEQGIGAEVAAGDGTIGTVAASRRMVRITGVACHLRYGRAIRGRIEEQARDDAALAPEIPLPGLCDAQAQIALPLLAGERLVGVLAVESRDPLQFDEWDEAFLQIVGNQIALGIDRMQAADEEPDAAAAPRSGATARTAKSATAPPRTRNFVYYKNDDCVFVDGEYLVRNLPGKIFWKLLARRRDGQVEFTNRELRLDPTLGLPPIKDNLESRLILLRKRLVEKCPDVRLVPVRRGRFALELDCAVELVEKESA